MDNLKPLFSAIDAQLVPLMEWYDLRVYHPLSESHAPVVSRIPRTFRGYHWFTANTVTLARTALVLPILHLLKYGHGGTAALLVLFHDYLDHIDGIVARCQKGTEDARGDDPVLGQFLDAFCDKVVCVSVLAGALLTSDYGGTVALPGMGGMGGMDGMGGMGGMQAVSAWVLAAQWVFLTALPLCVIASEVALGIVRVDDFYTVKHGVAERNLSASMAGKLKEKLESMGIAMMCVWATGGGGVVGTVAAWMAVVCLALVLRFAYESLSHKLSARGAGKAASSSEQGKEEGKDQ